MMNHAADAEFDVLILGAGPIGQACALLLARHWPVPGRIGLLDAKSFEDALQDPRVLALSHGSRQILERVQAWPSEVIAIDTVHVSHRGYFGRTVIRAREQKLPALGYVTSYGALLQQLQHPLVQSGVTVLRPLSAHACTEHATHVSVHTSQHEIRTQFLIYAEGGMLNSQTPLSSLEPPSKLSQLSQPNQCAVISFVTTTHPQAQTAFERFTQDGPLALLPFKHKNQTGYSLVWCCPPERAQQLAHCSDTVFLVALQEAFGDRVGRFLTVAQRVSLPLRPFHNETATGTGAEGSLSLRSIAIGNASQTLHPVAGQGLNLGLRDALTLTALIKDASMDIPRVLQGYVAQRRCDRNLMRYSTQFLAHGFSDYGVWVAPWASVGLTLLDGLPCLRHPLAQQMVFGQRR